MAIKLRLRATWRIEAVAAGVGPGGLGGLNADDPAYGQSLSPGAAPISQTQYFQDAEIIPGTDGSITLANIKTASDAASTTLAGATGTPLIDAAMLARLNTWFSGGG